MGGHFLKISVISLAFPIYAAALYDALSARIQSSLGTHLSQENPHSSLTLEPEFHYSFSDGMALSLYAAVLRPIKSTENFSVPQTTLRLEHNFTLFQEPAQARYLLTLLELERWKAEGHLIRNGADLRIEKLVGPNFTLNFRLGAWVQSSRYTQRSSGESNPHFGLSQLFGAQYRLGDFIFDCQMQLVQAKAPERWDNHYAHEESIRYHVSESLYLGISHEILASYVDNSTGFYQPIQALGGKHSRIATFLQLYL